MLGIHGSRELAERHQERARLLPGFRDHPEGFEISEYALDKDEWNEGFVFISRYLRVESFLALPAA